MTRNHKDRTLKDRSLSRQTLFLQAILCRGTSPVMHFLLSQLEDGKRIHATGNRIYARKNFPGQTSFPRLQIT